MEIAFVARTARSFTLRQIVIADAMTCFVFGLLLVAASAPLSPLLGLPQSLLFYAGVILFPCAALMGIAAKTSSKPLIGTVIAGNVAWIAASIAVLFLFPTTGLGVVFLLAQAGAVAVLAALEWRAVAG
jgi:hypothetical protein